MPAVAQPVYHQNITGPHLAQRIMQQSRTHGRDGKRDRDTDSHLLLRRDRLYRVAHEAGVTQMPDTGCLDLLQRVDNFLRSGNRHRTDP